VGKVQQQDRSSGDVSLPEATNPGGGTILALWVANAHPRDGKMAAN
jgi:hypothetical protein